MTDRELAKIRERLAATAPRLWELNQFESDANAAIIAAKSLLAEVDILRGLLSDRVTDSDFATEIERRATMRERERCVAKVDEARLMAKRSQDNQGGERGADSWTNSRVHALTALAERMVDAGLPAPSTAP